jgi:hypothetical protein
VRYDSLSAIQRLIELGIEEGTSLEYKSELALVARGDRKELLKDLTGMGNGGGGSVIFGIQEESGTNVAKALSPLLDPKLIGQIEDIIRSAVRPPLLWSRGAFEVAGGGFVLVLEVEPSPLGPYMIDAYEERRYYKRTGERVHPMTEQEVRDGYAIAARTFERRDQLWRSHSLPMAIVGNQPGIVVSALPEEPLIEIFDAKQIDLPHFVAPPTLRNYKSHTGLSFALSNLRHWADGLTADDGVNGSDPGVMVRLHRDGGAGLAQALRPELSVEWTIRITNALLCYLIWFWQTCSLQHAVELELAIEHLETATVPANSFGSASQTVVEPSGVRVSRISVREVALPWELSRSSVRHRVLQRFADRIEQAFGRPGASAMFSRGWLFDKSGLCTGLAMDEGMIWNPRQHVRIALIDSGGQIVGSNGVCGYSLDGVAVDLEGRTLATLEMATGVGCPDDFLPDVRQVEDSPLPSGVEPMEPSSPSNAPLLSGNWSPLTLNEALSSVER